MATPEQKKHNRRLGLILASIAVVFFLGFMTKMVLLSR
ncbi:cytochrome oxidase small assembly protein [uncultured Xylophilus sp.]|nr:cytochrome oxidase small assembly protein [uncultured Xylophilus sp.]